MTEEIVSADIDLNDPAVEVLETPVVEEVVAEVAATPEAIEVGAE